MRPKLKSDVLYVPTSEGVHVFGAGADLALHGRGAYEWLNRLAPHLDGSRPLEELVRGLPRDKRAAVERLVGRLRQAGCLLDAEEDLPHGLTPWEQEAYAQEIALVEYYRSSAAHRFERYRDTAVTVVGSGPVFVALVASVLRSGVRRLRLVRDGTGATDEARLAELVAEAVERDPDQRVLWADEPRGDVVLHVAVGRDARRAADLARACRASGALLVQGVVVDDVAWLGPAGDEWESAWLRLDLQPPYRGGEFLTGPAAAVVAGHVGMAAFRAVTGIDSPRGTEMTRIDLETLRTSRHAFVPHPAAAPARPEAAEAFTERIVALRTAAPLSAEEFSTRAAALFDPWVGVLHGLDERDFVQLPLNVTEAVLRTGGGGRRVFGAGDGFADARLRATLRAIAVYAAGAPDERRCAADGMVWGWDMAHGRARAVPIARAFARDTGLSARLDWAGAVTDGLGQHVARLAVEDVAAGRAKVRPLHLEEAELRPRERALWELLDAGRGQVRVARIDDALGPPVLAWWQQGRPLGATCGPGAVVRGLARALLDRQSTMTGQALYGPRLTPELGPCPQGPRSAVLPAEANDEEMVRALSARGLCPVAVPLDHDPAVHAVLPSVLRIVLSDD